MLRDLLQAFSEWFAIDAGYGQANKMYNNIISFLA